MSLSRSKALALCLAGVVVSVASGAAAQAPVAPVSPTSTTDPRQRVAGQRLDGDLALLGTVIAPNVVLMGGSAIEAGYERNPDELFGVRTGASFGLTNHRASLGKRHELGASTFSAAGSYKQFDDTSIDARRWDFAVGTDHFLRFNNGIEVNVGGYYVADRLQLVDAIKWGGYARLQYQNKDLHTAFLLGSRSIDYAGVNPYARDLPEILRPLVAGEAFSYSDNGASWSIMLRPNERISPYAEVGASRYNYFDDTNLGIYDRDASEVWGKAGLRVTLHPGLIIEAGYRQNHRAFAGGPTTEYSMGGLDGRVTLVPIKNITLSASFERSFAEPSALLAVAADQKRLAFHGSWDLTPQLSAGFAGHFRELHQIGDRVQFNEQKIGTYLSYQLTPKQSIYGRYEYDRLEEETSGASYERSTIGLGTRFRY